MRSFKTNENIHKKEGGSYYVVSATKASSVTLQSPGNESQRKHTVEANVMNIYEKFQLHLPYGLWEEDFLFYFFFFENLAFWLSCELDQIHMVGRGPLQKHFCIFFFKIPTVTQK